MLDRYFIEDRSERYVLADRKAFVSSFDGLCYGRLHSILTTGKATTLNTPSGDYGGTLIEILSEKVLLY